MTEDRTDTGALVARTYLVSSRMGADILAVSLMLIFCAAAVTLSVLPVITSELRTTVGLTDAEIGLLTSVFMGFYGVAGISSGIGIRLTRRNSRKSRTRTRLSPRPGSWYAGRRPA